MSNPVDPPVSADIEKRVSRMFLTLFFSGMWTMLMVPESTWFGQSALAHCKPCAEALQRRLKEPS